MSVCDGGGGGVVVVGGGDGADPGSGGNLPCSFVPPERFH